MTLFLRTADRAAGDVPAFAMGSAAITAGATDLWTYAVAPSTKQVLAFHHTPQRRPAILFCQTQSPAGAVGINNAPTLGYRPNSNARGWTSLAVKSPVLPDAPFGAVTDLAATWDASPISGSPGNNTKLWVVGAGGTLMELDLHTLALLASYGAGTFGGKLTPMRTIGCVGSQFQPNARHLFLQGRPGQLLAWNTGTKRVDHAVETGLGKLTSSVAMPLMYGAPASVRSTKTWTVGDGVTVLDTDDWQVWAQSGQPFTPEGVTKLYRNGVELPEHAPAALTPVAIPGTPAANQWARGPGAYQVTLGAALAGAVYSLTVFQPASVCAVTNDRGQVGYFSYNMLTGWTKIAVAHLPQLVGVQGATALTGFPSGVSYLVKRDAGLQRRSALVTLFYGQGDDLYVNPTPATIEVVEYGAGNVIAGMTERQPGEPGFKLAYISPPNGSFDMLPLAIAQQSAHSTGRASDTDLRWVIPCVDGAIWYYSDEAT